MTNMLSTFHFLRPLWLLAMLPLVVLLWQMFRQRLASRSWQNVIDAQLLPHVLIGKRSQRSPLTISTVGLGGALAVLALAGPAWQKLEQPVFRQQSALVVLLDLSRSMDATDIKPSRLQRAELKLRDILEQRKEGDTALVVYAATPFVVTPLSSDAKTIASQIDSLTTDLMPAQGSRPDRAIAMAQQLLTQAGATHGGVLLIADRVDGPEPAALKDAVTRLVAAGHRLSVMGVGTPEGAPIPDSTGGFVKSNDGSIVLPKLDDAALQQLADEGRGSYRRLTADDSDFHALLEPFENVLAEQAGKKVEGMKSDQWRDEGPWLLLPLLLLGALAFRRGYLLILLVMLMPLPRPAYALDWSSLWQRDDQRAQQALTARDAKKAAQLFHDPQWRAAANYRAGDFQAAVNDLKGVDNAEAAYNRGNALAQLGSYQDAIGAYDDALKRKPDFADAQHNRELVEKLLQQQKGPQQNSGKSQGSSQSSQNQSEHGKQQSSQSQSSAASSRAQGQSSAQSSPNSSSGSQQGKQDSAQSSGRGSSQGASQSASQSAQHSSASSRDNHSLDMNPSHSQSTQSSQAGTEKPAAAAEDQKVPKMTRADEQWLRRIPDDPGGLWRRKFLYQYKKQQQTQGSEKRPW